MRCKSNEPGRLYIYESNPRLTQFSLDLNRYNSLPDDEAQPPVLEQHILALAKLFVRENVHKKLGIHLVHGHFELANNTILLGKNFESPSGRWSSETPFDAIQKNDISQVHGHIFVYRKGALIAYELQDGPVPDLSGIREQFFVDYVDYLVKNRLENLVGLQILDQSHCAENETMWELVLEHGTIILDAKAVKGCAPTVVTGWKFEVSHSGEPRVCQQNEVHSKIKTGNHRVFNAGKPLPKLETVEDLKQALVEVGVLLISIDL